MVEIWKDIPGFENEYQCSTFGNFKSLQKIDAAGVIRKERLMRPTIESNGYHQIGFQVSGKQKRYLAHRIIAKTFISGIQGKDFINHKNGIKTDNRVENLEWVTKSENAIHSFKIGLQCNKGEQHPRAKITDKIVLEIRLKYAYGNYSSRKLAKEYGLSKTNILDIVNQKIWNHI